MDDRLVRPDQGEVEIDGERSVANGAPRRRSRRNAHLSTDLPALKEIGANSIKSFNIGTLPASKR